MSVSEKTIPLEPRTAAKPLVAAQAATKEVLDVVPQRQVVFTRKPGGKWEVEFKGPVARRDVNRLRMALVIEFGRMKRRAHLRKQQADRNNQLKESQNAQ